MWKRIRHFKVYRQLLISYVLIVLVTVSLISGILYAFFSSRATKEINDNSIAFLAQTSYAADVIYQQVNAIGGQLLNNSDVISFLYAPRENKIVNYHAVGALDQINAVYPFIKYVGLYNGFYGRYIDSLNLPREANGDLLDAAPANQYVDIRPRIVNNPYGSASYHLLTFILYPDFSFSLPSKDAITINVDEDYLQKVMQGINNSPSQSDTFLMNASGTVISHSDPDYFMDDFSGQAFVRRILASKQSYGWFTQNVDGDKQLITYVKSTDLNGYFVNMKAYNAVFEDILRLREITIAVTLLLILLGLLLAVGFSRAIYNPMKALVDKVGAISGGSAAGSDEYAILADAFFRTEETARTMRADLTRSYPTIKENYLINLLKTSLRPVDSPAKLIRQIEAELQGPYFGVIAIKMDRFRLVREQHTPGGQALLRFAISNIAQEKLAYHFVNDAVAADQDEVVMIAQLRTDRLDERAVLTLTEIQDVIRSYFRLTVTIAVGDIVGNRGELGRSYKSAVEYAKYRMFFGTESIIDLSRIEPRLPIEEKYPSSREKQLIEALQLGDGELVRVRIGQWIQAIGGLTYYQAVNFTSQLTLNLSRHFESSADWFDEAGNDDYDVLNRIRDAETLADIEELLRECCEKIAVLLDRISKRAVDGKYSKIVERVQSHIQEHFSEPGLSIETTADVVGLSPGYLRKLFKKLSHLSFNDYLNRIRLEEARRLLTDTDEPAAKIGKQVGIHNAAYFSTLFKKHYGFPPSRYREGGPHEDM